MSPVGQLARAELIKLRTTRTAFGFALAAVGLSLLAVVLTVTSAERVELEGAQGVRSVLGSLGGFVALFALCLGVVSMAGEARHGTLDEALMAAPARWPLCVAKAIVCGVAGAGLGLLVWASSSSVAALVMAGRGEPFSVLSDVPLEVLLGIVAAGAAFSAIGVGLGAVIHDQTWALTAAVAWVLVLDQLALSQAPDAGRLLPGGGLAAATHGTGQNLLSQGQGLLLLAGWVALLGLIGIGTLRRRDVT